MSHFTFLFISKSRFNLNFLARSILNCVTFKEEIKSSLRFQQVLRLLRWGKGKMKFSWNERVDYAKTNLQDLGFHCVSTDGDEGLYWRCLSAPNLATLLQYSTPQFPRLSTGAIQELKFTKSVVYIHCKRTISNFATQFIVWVFLWSFSGYKLVLCFAIRVTQKKKLDVYQPGENKVSVLRLHSSSGVNVIAWVKCCLRKCSSVSANVLGAHGDVEEMLWISAQDGVMTDEGMFLLEKYGTRLKHKSAVKIRPLKTDASNYAE